MKGSMSSRPPSPEELVALERAYDDLPEGEDARMWAAIEGRLGLGGDGGDNGGEGGPGESGQSGGGPRSEGGQRSDGSNGSAGSDRSDGGASVRGGAFDPSKADGAGALSSSSVSPWLAEMGFLGVGIVIGATVHAWVAAPRSRDVAVAPVAAVSSPSSMNEPHEVPAPSSTVPSISVDVLPRAPRAPEVREPATHSTADKTARPPSTDEERAGLEVARSALAQGRAGACLEALEKHARMFGTGRYDEEREALWIQALVTAQRQAEAEARARQFRVRYPHSLFGSVVSDAIRHE